MTQQTKNCQCCNVFDKFNFILFRSEDKKVRLIGCKSSETDSFLRVNFCPSCGTDLFKFHNEEHTRSECHDKGSFDGEVLTLSEFEAFLREKDTYKLLPERLNAHQDNVLAYYWLMHCAFFDNVRYTSIYLRCRSHLKGLDEMLDEADPFEIVVKDLTQKAFGL